MASSRVGAIIARVIFWLVVLGAAAGAGAYFYMQEPETQVTATQVGRGPVEETVAAISSGTVMPEQRAMVAAGMLGKLFKIYVEEGQRVNQGDMLVELEHEELDAQVEVARANLEAARPRVEQARLGVSIQADVSSTQQGQAAAQLEMARRDFERMKSLADQQAISTMELDRAATALRVAEETAAAATATGREGAVRQQDVAASLAMIEQLEATVAAAEVAREKAFVKAPFSGVVADIMLQEGEAVAMGLPLLHLVQDDTLYVEAPFDEANAAQISVGMQARIEVDAFPEEIFAGEVNYIAPMVSMNTDLSRTITVKVKILEGEDRLLAGMSADVTVISERKDNVLLVPSESLVRDEFAYVVEGGYARQRDVELGIGNWEFREILSGLSEGDTIITSVGIKGLTDGTKVRVVEELPE